MNAKKGMIKRLIERIKNIYRVSRDKVLTSIRLQLIFVFAICLIASSLAGSISSNFAREKYATLDYSVSIDNIDSTARRIVEEIERIYSEPQEEPGVDTSVYSNTYISEPPYSDTDKLINRVINAQASEYKTLIVDLNGVVLYRTKNTHEDKVQLHVIIKNALDTRIDGENSNISGKEFVSFYPVELGQQKAYVVVSAYSEPHITYRYTENGLFIFIVTLATFFSLFYLLTKKKMQYIEELAQGLREISKGDLSYKVAQKSNDELGSLAQNINHMAEELRTTIEEERRAERTKNELITNVSHDLRTPLTSVMGYLRLLQDKKYDNREQAENYLNIAYSKSEKLKNLLEDLFEYTKLTNKGYTLKTETISIDEMLEQLIEEFVPLAEENKLRFIKNLPMEKLLVNVDVDKMVRVFENLLMNAIRYSYKPGKIKVSVVKSAEKVIVSIQNKGEEISQQEVEHLFERFYKVEKARTSDTSGSGLGLAIAKNIVEMHGGSIWAECKENDIFFNVSLKLS